MVSKTRNRINNVGKKSTMKARPNHTRKFVDMSKKHRQTMRGGKNQYEYIHVEFFKKKTGPNIGRIIRVVQDPIFGTNTNDIADMSYLFGKRMGEVDEVIEIMKNGRKEKPYKRILYRLSFNDKHGPMMSYSGKQIKKCGGPSAPTFAFNPILTKTPTNTTQTGPVTTVSKKTPTRTASNKGPLNPPYTTKSGRTSIRRSLHNAQKL